MVKEVKLMVFSLLQCWIENWYTHYTDQSLTVIPICLISPCFEQYPMQVTDIYHITVGICLPIATTQPTTQNNLKQLCWGGIIIGKKKTPQHHHHQHTTTTTISPPPPHHRVSLQFKQPTKLNFVIQPYYNITRRNI